jgi:heme exporter protein D
MNEKKKMLKEEKEMKDREMKIKKENEKIVD